MLPTVSSIKKHQDYATLLSETASRRIEKAEFAKSRNAINAELSNIKEQIQIHIDEQIRLQRPIDSTTKQIMIWERNFTNVLLDTTTIDPNQIKHEYIKQLQEDLYDPLIELKLLEFPSITHVLLDEEALLGTDSNTYGCKTLSLYQSLPNKDKNKSPINSENQVPFKTNPHPLVRYMIQWLKQQGVSPRYEPIENGFNSLPEDEKVLPIAADKADKLKQLMAMEKQRNFMLKQKIEAGHKEIKEKISRKVRQIIDNTLTRPLLERNERHYQQSCDTIHSLEIKMERETEQLKKSIHKLDKEIDRLSIRNSAIEEQLSSINSMISDAEKDLLLLEFTINEVKKANKKKKRKERKQVLVTIAIVGCSIFATYGLTAVLQQSGSSFAAAVVPKAGGAMFMAFIPKKKN